MSDGYIDRWDWLLGSIVLATLASLLHWFLHYITAIDDKRGSPGDTRLHMLSSRALRTIESPWVTLPIRLIYAIGIPAAALFWQGALTARGLGLQALAVTTFAPAGVEVATQNGNQGPVWADDFSWLVVVTGATALAIAAGARIAHRLAPRRLTAGRRSLGRALLEAVYYEVHWAFYREPFVYSWGIGIGSWLGALPVVLEIGMSLMFWERLHSRGSAYQRQALVRVGLFVASTQLYLLTQNLWLAVALDALVGWLALRWRDRPAIADQSVTSEAMTAIR